MESDIIRTFKRLRALTPNFKFRGSMDDLVNDLSHALQETSCIDGRPCGGRSRRRRGRKRRSKCASISGVRCCNNTCKLCSCIISEDSESSLDLSSVSNRYHAKSSEMMKMDQDKCSQPSTLSDTDDLKIINQFRQAIRISQGNENMGARWTGGGVSVGESDSVNENFSPVRPNRKRRKFKRMDLDFCPIEEKLQNSSLMKSPQNSLSPAVNQFVMVSQSHVTQANPATLTCGKRKRNVRERSLEVLESDIDAAPGISSSSGSNCASRSQIFNNTESSVSSLSSSESETDLLKRDEGREADDEQSDFFHESGPTCGIPGMKSCWSSDRKDDDEADAKMEQLLNDCFEQSSSSAQRSYHYNLEQFNNIQRRDFRTGHRRLKRQDMSPSSATPIDNLLTEFLQDPNQDILTLPPVSRREKAQIYKVASVYLLRPRAQGHGLTRRLYLVKTPSTNQKIRGTASSLENSSSLHNNNVLGNIKRRKKISSEMGGESNVKEPRHNSKERLPLGLRVCMSEPISSPPIFSKSQTQVHGHSSTADEPMMG